jgi:DNA recombination protein RmuC
MNDIFYLAIAFVAGSLLGLLIGYLWFKQKLQSISFLHAEENSRLETEKQGILADLEKKKLEWEKNLLAEKTRIKEEFNRIEQALRQELTVKEQEIINWERKWKDEQAHFKEKEEKFKQEFENLAQKILDDKAEKFTKQNKESLDTILNPFTKAIKDFKEKVIENDKQSHGRHQALYEQLKQLKELNAQLSQEALNLTKALKGETKTQGIWGETILNNLLEKSGLEKDREYFTQQSFTVDNGGRQKRLQPDVVIHLPNNKKMIIDAKVSLVAYEKYVNAEDEETAKIAAKEHVRSIKNHIDGLQKKNYEDLLKGESPEFILMFIPIEPAFSLALKEDPSLYNYAFKFNIVMVTPSTLLATLKIVDNMWTNERQTRNAIEIADQAGKLYDKFHGLLEDLKMIGNRLDSAQDSYNNAFKKLSSGRGNLLGQVEKLKKLGAKAKKQLPPPEEE